MPGEDERELGNTTVKEDKKQGKILHVAARAPKKFPLDNDQRQLHAAVEDSSATAYTENDKKKPKTRKKQGPPCFLPNKGKNQSYNSQK